MLLKIDTFKWKLRDKEFINLPEVTKLVSGGIRIARSYNFRDTTL
jgi:hypothetical protein